MTKRSVLIVAGALLCLTTASAEQYRAIFWNLQSGDSDANALAAQMLAKGEVDFWGFSEVANQGVVNTIEQALEKANPKIDYIAKLSEDGAGDRLAILYRSDRLTAVSYSGTAAVDDIGDNFFEVDSINVGGTIRPALGVQLTAPTGDVVVVLVNHWKCCEDEARRKLQAIQMNAFAGLTPGIPIVAGGDFNIPLNSGSSTQEAFVELSQIWEYRQPQPNVGSHRGGSVLDAVFVTNRVPGWESSTTILEREGNSPATTKTFSDNGSQTDHRPLQLVVDSDVRERLEGLREAIADMEAALEALKKEVERLEAANPN